MANVGGQRSALVSHHVHVTTLITSIMATASSAKDTDFRRKWDKEAYAEKARKKDDEERERMKENEERMKQGKFNVLDVPSSQFCIELTRETAIEGEERRPTKTH